MEGPDGPATLLRPHNCNTPTIAPNIAPNIAPDIAPDIAPTTRVTDFTADWRDGVGRAERTVPHCFPAAFDTAIGTLPCRVPGLVLQRSEPGVRGVHLRRVCRKRQRV